MLISTINWPKIYILIVIFIFSWLLNLLRYVENVNDIEKKKKNLFALAKEVIV